MRGVLEGRFWRGGVGKVGFGKGPYVLLPFIISLKNRKSINAVKFSL